MDLAGLHRPDGTAPGVGGGGLAVVLVGVSCQQEQHLRGGVTPEGTQTDMSQAGRNLVFLKIG